MSRMLDEGRGECVKLWKVYCNGMNLDDKHNYLIEVVRRHVLERQNREDIIIV